MITNPTAVFTLLAAAVALVGPALHQLHHVLQPAQVARGLGDILCMILGQRTVAFGAFALGGVQQRAAFGRQGEGSGVVGVDVQRIRRSLGLQPGQSLPVADEADEEEVDSLNLW